MADSNLTKMSRKTEEFGLTKRHDYQAVPPKVDYSLTETGRKLILVMRAMEAFSRYYCEGI